MRGVTVDIEGSAADLAAFERRVARTRRRWRGCSPSCTTSQPAAQTRFVIAPSRERPGAPSVPPDTATCTDCLRELRDPADQTISAIRSSRCTNCGPRLSIITDIPYDRARDDGRLHDVPDLRRQVCRSRRPSPSRPAHRLSRLRADPDGPRSPGCRSGWATWRSNLSRTLGAGLIVAIKGPSAAITWPAMQRTRGRPPASGAQTSPRQAVRADGARPPTAETLLGTEEHHAARLAATASLDASRRAEVLGGRRPDRRRAQATRCAGGRRGGAGARRTRGHALPTAGSPSPVRCHPGTGRCAPSVLVMTSGNLGDEPLAFDDHDAPDPPGRDRGPLLTHDRRIHVPVEDSVVTIDDAGVVPIRRSRGHARFRSPAADRTGRTRAPPGARHPRGRSRGSRNTCCLTRRDWAFCSRAYRRPGHTGESARLRPHRPPAPRPARPPRQSWPPICIRDMPRGHGRNVRRRRTAYGSN